MIHVKCSLHNTDRNQPMYCIGAGNCKTKSKYNLFWQTAVNVTVTLKK